MNNMKISSSHQSGFTLIEVLSAVVILSIGLLGIAGLQAVAKKANADAIQRTTATMLAYDIIERMRANKDNLSTYVINNDAPFTDSNATNANGDDVSSATTCGHANSSDTTTCTPQQMVLYDLNRWRDAIIGATETLSGANTGGLVQPSACIVQQSSGGTPVPGAYTVAIAWRGKSPLSNPTASTCGEATGFYDKNSGDNVYRRLLTIDFYSE